MATSMDDPYAPAWRHDELALLWNRVLHARDVVEEQRQPPVPVDAWVARAQLLHALEEYALSLTRHRRPIPYVLRDELRLRRGCG